MDFGLLSHKQSGTNEPTGENFDGSLKRERSVLFDDDDLRFSKMPYELRQSDLTAYKCGEGFGSLGRSNNVVWPSLSVDGQKMLCFASSDQPPQYFGNDSSSRSIAFSIPQDEHRGGGVPSEATRGSFSRIKSPFTPSQWMELENQAWIYKYLSANLPVPQSLLVPLRRSIYSQGSPGSFPPNLFGWDMPFPLGLLGSKDPEPGRCRRTDGKKWRCSREAVPDQKYCERHINRGRQRSRKPVEASQTNGHVITGGSSTTDIAPFNEGGASDPSLKFAPMVISNGGGSNGLGIFENLDPSIGLKPKEFTFGGLTHMDFGLLTSDPLLSPSRVSYTSNAAATGLNAYWQEGPKYDWTQLSMSIPDFSSQHGPSSVHADRALLEPVREKNRSGFPSIGGPLGEAMIIGGNVLYKSSP